ncbi:MAG TPA: cellulase family glycosylhydrolase [Chthoniobacteraceae bacterium]|nr:cellulase family glycosylhydrolase [Chthoniobacteraceae bacterium]
MKPPRLPLISLVLVLSRALAADPHPSLPPIGSLDGLGVNIHFTDPQPGEMEMIAAAGFKWVRMDFAWGGTEREKGVYDFSAYDRLVAALDKQKMRAVFILDYGNKLYDSGNSPRTDETRAAFAKWAAAAVKHFSGRGYLWEMWNEPNGGFWKPKVNVDEYIALTKATAKALRDAGLGGEAFIGPATSTIDLPFLEACFKGGLLEDWCAVSVHPYRQGAPENVEEEYRKVRILIHQYAPKDKAVPIISGEWGYSTGWKGMDETRQAEYAVREFLTNIANDVPLSIWYDWRDDGDNPADAEDRFGLVRREYHEGRDPVYDPKPAYIAVKMMMTQLHGMKFNKRLGSGFPGFCPMLFTKQDGMCLVFWGKSRWPQEDWLDVSPAAFVARDLVGGELDDVVPEKGHKIDFHIGDAPKYFVPRAPNDLLLLAAAWERLPLEVFVDPKKTTAVPNSFKNPLDHAITTDNPEMPQVAAGNTQMLAMKFEASREERIETTYTLGIRGIGSLSQRTVLVASRPFHLEWYPVMGKTLAVRVENPTGDEFHGEVAAYYNDEGDSPKSAITLEPKMAALDFAHGETAKTVFISLDAVPPAFHTGDIGIFEGSEADAEKGIEALMDQSDSGPDRIAGGLLSFARAGDFDKPTAATLLAAYKLVGDGDAAVASALDLAPAPAPDGLPVAGTTALHLTYTFGAGWKFLRMVPLTDKLKEITGVPVSFGIWIFGDGKGCIPRIRFIDKHGQTFQASGPKIDWKGWRYVTIPIRLDVSVAGSYSQPAEGVTHWGGSNDGQIEAPIKWDSILLLDNPSREAVHGEIYLSTPTFSY